MFVGLVAAAAVVAALALVAVLFIQRGREGIDLTPRNLLRTYLYAGSFAGLAAFVFGVAALGNFALAAAAGSDVVYGAPPVPRPAIAPACPPNFPNCPQPPSVEDQLKRMAEQNERRRNEDLLRGVTFTVFGGLFYAAHYASRRALVGAEETQSALRRAYLMVGTAVFGLATVVLWIGSLVTPALSSCKESRLAPCFVLVKISTRLNAGSASSSKSKPRS